MQWSGIYEKRTCGRDEDTGVEAEAGAVGLATSFLKLAGEKGMEAGVRTDTRYSPSSFQFHNVTRKTNKPHKLSIILICTRTRVRTRVMVFALHNHIHESLKDRR